MRNEDYMVQPRAVRPTNLKLLIAAVLHYLHGVFSGAQRPRSVLMVPEVFSSRPKGEVLRKKTRPVSHVRKSRPGWGRKCINTFDRPPAP